MLRAFSIAAFAAIAAVGVAFAANEGEHPENHPFSFDSPVGGYDMGAVQRGFQVYNQVCANCHAMAHQGVGTPRTVAELRRIIGDAGFLRGSTVTDEQLEAERQARELLGPQ